MKLHRCKTLVDNTHGLIFTENPRWRGDKLWFVDVFGQRILTVDVAGRMEVAAELPFKPNGFGHMRDGSILVSDALARQIYRLDGGRLELFADLTNMTVFGLSDGFVDANDRMYIGDMGYNLFDPAEKPVDTCVIVCVQPDGRADVVARGLAYPNGMVATPDGKTLIVAESYGRCLTAFDIAADGSLSNRRVWALLPEDVHPDGIGLDAEGAVWLANPENTGGRPTVLRVREGGEIVEGVELDSFAYAVMLGGPQRRHLFINASGHLDPATLLSSPTATLRIVEVEVPGAGTP
ncbi:MAG: SMP-30/gluconolactonase/LRE family protein [Steroidobacteraceae bacterium]